MVHHNTHSQIHHSLTCTIQRASKRLPDARCVWARITVRQLSFPSFSWGNWDSEPFFFFSLFINSTIFKRNPRCQKHFAGCYWSISQGLSSQIAQGERETTTEQGRKRWAKCEWECKRGGYTPMGHSQGTIPGCSDIGSSWKHGPKLFRSCWVGGIFHFLSEPRFIFIFSVMVYYRILNIVPCGAQYDLVVYPFYI